MNDKNRSVSQLVEKNHAKISESFKLERKFLPLMKLWKISACFLGVNFSQQDAVSLLAGVLV